jgi:methyl-accepting chemotaxis protein
MGEIFTAVNQVSTLIAEIKASSHSQSTGLEKLNDTVTEMDESTQRNAAMTEEAAAASSLQEQAIQLTLAVGVFKLNESSVTRDAGSSGAGAGGSDAGSADMGGRKVAIAQRKAAGKPALALCK